MPNKKLKNMRIRYKHPYSSSAIEGEVLHTELSCSNSASPTFYFLMLDEEGKFHTVSSDFSTKVESKI